MGIMSQFRRRTMVIVLGLFMGWYVSGIMGPYLSGIGTSSAGAVSESGYESDPQASLLVPNGEIPWLRPVLWSAGGLFFAAIIFGIPVTIFRTPDSSGSDEDHH